MLPDLYSKMDIPAEDQQTALGIQKARFLMEFLAGRPIELSLETGFAYGGSAAHIITATQAPHYAIDPFQQSVFESRGEANLTRLGLADWLRPIYQPAHVALPNLLQEQVKLDFALIDGDHKFDSAFVDFYFLDLLVKPFGHIAIDDCRMPSVASLIDWIRSNKPYYQEISTGVTGLTLWQKAGQEQRPWQHFVPFQTHPLWRRIRAFFPHL